MQKFMIALLTCSAVMSAVILLFMAFSRLLIKRYSAKGLYCAWLIIAIGLMIPIRPHIHIPVVAGATVEAVSAVPMHPWIGNMVSAPIHTATPPPALPGIPWWQCAAAVWLAGTIFVLVYRGVQHCRFVKMANRWSEDIADEEMGSLLQELKTDMGISREIVLFRCPCIASPMMVGLFNPRILLPTAEYGKDALRFILKHELVHYKRKDLWGKGLILAATAMHWFNPAVYLMAKAMDVQCELACDAETVRRFDIHTRRRYSETILGVVRQSSLKTALSTNFNGGKNGMRIRISSIMDTKKKKIGLAVICMVLVLTVGAGIVYAAKAPDNMGPDVMIRLRDDTYLPEDFGTTANFVDARPGLEFYIEGEDIAKIEVTCETEYVYAVDWTETQHEKYWNTEYFQTYDEETQTGTFYPARLYGKSMTLTMPDGFDDCGDIWYRWTAWNLYRWASENNYSHFLLSDKEMAEDMTEDQKRNLAAGDDGSGRTGIGHIQLDGYPEELTEDTVTIVVTDSQGHSTVKIINIKVSNNERNETVITACVAE